MSSKSKHQKRAKHISDKTPKQPEFKKPKDHGVGPFEVVVDVYGPKLDSHGRDTGHIDPKNHVQMTLHDTRLVKDGGSVQGALSKMRTFSYDEKGKKVYDQMPFYKIVSVIDHGKIELENILKTLAADIADAIDLKAGDDDFCSENEFYPEEFNLKDVVGSTVIAQTEGAL